MFLKIVLATKACCVVVWYRMLPTPGGASFAIDALHFIQHILWFYNFGRLSVLWVPVC